MTGTAKDVVLVHGAMLNGSVWRPVHDILVRNGFAVGVAQLPLRDLEGDVAAVRRVLAPREGPVVLVGHSYGGAVISVAGADPKVAALVHVAAYQPDVGESASDLEAKFPIESHRQDVGDGLVINLPAMWRADVAADVAEDEAAFFAASQTPTSPAIFSAKVPSAAWRRKPSFGILATRDRAVSTDLQRWMYERSGAEVTEVAASHLVNVSQPETVAVVIMRAAQAAGRRP